MSDDEIDPDSIRARLDRAVAERLDNIIRRESEHSTYDLEDVRELYKQAL